MKLRSLDPLILEVTNDAIVASSPHLPHRVRLDAEAAKVLIGAREGIDVAGDNPATSLDTAANALRRAGLLTGEPFDDGEFPRPWDQWGALSWEFHEATRRARFIERGSTDEAAWTDHLQDADEPRPKSHAWGQRPAILLPRVHRGIHVSLWDVLENRRTDRTFERAAVSLEHLSTLLHYALAPMRFVDAYELGVLELRANAAGGARHETFGLVAAFDVDGLEPGVYGYDNIRHGLVAVHGPVEREVLNDLTYNQGFFTDVAFGLFLAADASRVSWKYKSPRAYRHLLQNVGTVVQVASMITTALGLGCALTGALKDAEFDDLLELDVPHEFTTFAIACGVPRRRQDGLPIDHRHPSRPFELGKVGPDASVPQ